MVIENVIDLGDIAFRPEDDPVFRMSQLLLLLDELQAEPTTLDRLTYYDFFAESPYLLFAEDTPERTELRLAGFESSTLSYLSPAQRFVTRQERVGGDLAALVAYHLADVSLVDRAAAFEISTQGAELSTRLRAMYADAYRTSARLVIRRLRRLSNKRLHEDARGSMDPDGERFWAVASRDEDSA
ncbi:MAG: hypothetical protein GY788_24010 [bacterium]|nr:hypothetical protein [bacterium]